MVLLEVASYIDMKIISFSLWGQNLKYCVGALRNAELALRFYPGWQCVFQVDALVPQVLVDRLSEMEHVDVIRRIDPETNGMVKGDWRAMMWRFEFANATGVEAMISRDCDSRLTPREAAAVEEWLSSDKGFHMMHDHPWHSVPILGGMFGIKNGCVPEFEALLANWQAEDRLQTDQEFLAQEIWPRVRRDFMNHDDGFFPQWNNTPFPSTRNGLEFVGEIYDENNRPNEEHRQVLANALLAR